MNNVIEFNPDVKSSAYQRVVDKLTYDSKGKRYYCPVCGSRSLSVTRSAELVKLHCHAMRCSYASIMASIGLWQADGFDLPAEQEDKREVRRKCQIVREIAAAHAWKNDTDKRLLLWAVELAERTGCALVRLALRPGAEAIGVAYQTVSYSRRRLSDPTRYEIPWLVKVTRGQKFEEAHQYEVNLKGLLKGWSDCGQNPTCVPYENLCPKLDHRDQQNHYLAQRSSPTGTELGNSKVRVARVLTDMPQGLREIARAANMSHSTARNALFGNSPRTGLGLVARGIAVQVDGKFALGKDLDSYEVGSDIPARRRQQHEADREEFHRVGPARIAAALQRRREYWLRSKYNMRKHLAVPPVMLAPPKPACTHCGVVQGDVVFGLCDGCSAEVTDQMLYAECDW